MNFKEIESWIYNDLLSNNNFNFGNYPKGVKVFEIKSTKIAWEVNGAKIKEMKDFLTKSIKGLTKKTQEPVFWFKINFVDNAFPDLVAIGKITELNDLKVLTPLLIHDTAEQAGDTVVGIFDEDEKWIYKITNCGEENRLYIKVYAKEHIVHKIKTYLN